MSARPGSLPAPGIRATTAAAARRQEPTRLQLIENPTCDLTFTEVEGADLRRLYPDHHVLYGGEATRERLLADAADCHVLHYSGHAVFNLQDPLASALVLGAKNDR